MVGLHDPHAPWTSARKYLDLYPLGQIVIPQWNGDAVPPYMQQFLNSGELERAKADGSLDNKIQAYLAEISEMDARLGELLDALAISDKNPIIVLWSDHGYSLGDHNHIHKFTLWDQTGRVPFMIFDPRMEYRGVRYSGVVSLLDIAPTL